MIVLLTIGGAVLAHVFTVQEISTGFTLEAPDVIVLVQSHQGLAIFKFFSTAGTSAFFMGFVGGHLGGGGGAGRGRGGGRGGGSGLTPRGQIGVDVGTSLTQAAFPRESDSFAGGKGLVADGALKAALVVSLAQSGDHLAFDKGGAFGALGAKVGLVAAGAVVFLVFAEKATL